MTVLARTVFVEQTKDGCFRFADWALTTVSGFGVMAEPFTPRQVTGLGDGGTTFDATDECALVTDIRHANSDLISTYMSGGVGPVHIGGSLMPRTGR